MAVMDATRIITIKEGDDIWVGNRYTTRDKVKRVVRVTNTRIVLEGLAEYNTYKRTNTGRRQDAGYSYGRSWSMDGDHITGFATKLDRKKQDDAEIAREAANKAREDKQTAQRNLTQELSDLFPEKLYVQGYTNGGDDTKNYSINGLSETQVRFIAGLLRGSK